MLLVLFSAFVRWLRGFRVRTLDNKICARITRQQVQNASDHHVSILDFDRERSISHFNYRSPEFASCGPGPNQNSGLKGAESSHAPDHASARARRQPPNRTRTLLRSVKNISIGLVFTTLALAQGSLQIYQATAPISETFNNSNPKYNAWTVMYSYSGSGTFSIELDCAPDATVAGGTPTPGSYTACTATTGVNPSTTPQYGYITFVGYETALGSAPWVKLNLTAISSGNLTAFAMGFTAADPESGTGGGGGCPGTKTTPCVVANLNGAGNVIIPNYCTDTAAINLSSVTGENQIIAASGSTVIRLCNIAVGMTGASTVSITAGTGTNCGTSTTTLWGPYPSNTTAFTQDLAGSILVLAGDAVCLNFGSTVTAGGGVSYSQF